MHTPQIYILGVDVYTIFYISKVNVYTPHGIPHGTPIGIPI